jgi:hypothetical protein
MDINTLTEVCLEKVRERKNLLKNLTSEEDVKKWQEETLDRYRCDLEPYIWQYFMFNYGPKLDEFWKKHQFPKKSKYAWLLVERRCNQNWWFLLRNMAWAGPNFSLYIFCSDENYEFIKKLLGDKAENVNIIKWFKGFATRQEGKDQYAQTFKLPGFYKLIESEYFIRVEMDTYLRHKIPESIFRGDFYGAPWGWKPELPGGGGLVIRKIKTMIDLCTKENNTNLEADDDWVGKKVIEYGLEYPSLEYRKEIFSENFPVADPVGVHQFWTFLENFEISNLENFKKHLTNYLRIHINE